MAAFGRGWPQRPATRTSTPAARPFRPGTYGRSTAIRLVVHRIFEEYISGAGFTQIAQRLNEQGVQSPRPRASGGRGWCPSAVRTIITNPKYKGCFIWNQSEWRKDHSTGKRKRFERPREEWVIKDRPDLQIVTPEVWEQANRTQRSRSGNLPRKRDGTLAGGSIGSGRRPTHLLSGLLRCGECGGPVHIVGGGKYACGWRHKRGPTICSAERCIKPDDLEARVLGTIQTQILVPEIVEEVACRSLDLAKSRFDHAQQSFSADRRRLDEIALEERNLSREIAKLGSSDEFYAVLDELHEEKGAIQSRVESSQPRWSPANLEEPIRAAISRFESLLRSSPEKAHQALQGLLRGNRIDIHHSPDSRDYHIEGVAELTLEAHTAGRPETTGRMLFSSRKW
jgi:site-specific DNA recombinase